MISRAHILFHLVFLPLLVIDVVWCLYFFPFGLKTCQELNRFSVVRLPSGLLYWYIIFTLLSACLASDTPLLVADPALCGGRPSLLLSSLSLGWVRFLDLYDLHIANVVGSSRMRRRGGRLVKTEYVEDILLLYQELTNKKMFTKNSNCSKKQANSLTCHVADS